MKPIDEMTKDEIKSEIAERIGWKLTNNPCQSWYLVESYGSTISGKIVKNLPNWPSDIAAAWELEESIPEADREAYAHELNRIVNRWLDAEYEKGRVIDARFYLLHASAEQRCRAWLAWKRGQDETR